MKPLLLALMLAISLLAQNTKIILDKDTPTGTYELVPVGIPPPIDPPPVTTAGYCDFVDVRCANRFPGNNVAEKIASATASLLAANVMGGVVDARGLQGSTTPGWIVRSGVQLNLPAGRFTLTTPAWVQDKAGMKGLLGSGSNDVGTVLTKASGFTGSCLVMAHHNKGPSKDRWWHYGRVQMLRLEPFGIDGLCPDQMGENSRISDVHIQSPRNGIKIGGVNLYPNSQAGSSRLRDVAIMGASNCALDLQHIAGEWFIDGLSGDDNRRFVCLESGKFGSPSIVFQNIKTEAFRAGRNNPVFDFRNTQTTPNILITGGRHTCGSGGCGPFIRISGSLPNKGPFIAIMAEQIAMGTPLIEDIPNKETTPAGNGRPGLFLYSGLNGDVDVRMWTARGLNRLMNNPGPPTGCTQEKYGSQYFDLSQGVTCTCSNKGNVWVRSDDANARCQ